MDDRATMKILNLYAGIGGNRKLWGDEHEIVAVEYNADIAKVYHEFYPNDTVIVGDAHKYLLNHYKEFDFIWASPPCPTHSDIRRCGVHAGQYEALYPDMTLYQQIILLQNFAPKKTKWVIENVEPYYEYLIKPTVNLGRHPFWSNFKIPYCEFGIDKTISEMTGKSENYGTSLDGFQITNKRQILRNMVNPEVGKYILDRAMNKEIMIQGGLFG
jgi:DNA (cytosine-5)-methyltransferase 1